MVLIFSTSWRSTSASKLVKSRSRSPTTSRASSRLESGVKSTTSAKRMLASSKWSAIELGSDWRRCAMSAGRTLSRSVSTRACAVSRPRANVTSNSIATSDTTTMLRTSKVPTKAANHGQALLGRPKATAPSGANRDQRITELDSSRPPSMMVPKAGATRIRICCAVRRNAKFRVRAKTARLIPDPVTYAHGVSATPCSPMAQYRQPHTKPNGRMMSDTPTRRRLRKRSSAVSRGSAPIERARSTSAAVMTGERRRRVPARSSSAARIRSQRNAREGAAVPATVLYMSMSLDGFIAGPNEGPDNGLGDGGERLHEWAFSMGADTDPHSGVPRRLPGVNGQVFDEFMTTGAVVAGRGTFEPAGGWGGDHHDGVPIFILTRHDPADLRQWP